LRAFFFSPVLWLLALCSFSKPLSSFEIQGHRGSRGTLPENSLIAFQSAIEQGIQVLEMDLLLTKDEEVVIFHDFHISSQLCTFFDGSPVKEESLVKDRTLLELRQLDCGRVKNQRFPEQRTVPGTKIPTLQELFALIESLESPFAKTCRLNLELKADPLFPEYAFPRNAIAKKVIEIVSQSRFSDRLYYSSFDLDLLSEVRKLDDTAVIGILCEESNLAYYGISCEEWIYFALRRASELGAAILSPDYELLRPRDVQLAHEAGLRVIPWTVNDGEVIEKLKNWGVDGIITDYPARAGGKS
jgi:glycerophosphoryl diester phosphodiesterase